jgi:threonine/homoserine/homoserine lactone efflux protein
VIPSGRLLAFIATAFVVIVIPGPSVLFVVGRALAGGRRVAMFSVLGNAAGEYVQVVMIAVGIGALVEQSAAAFTVLKVLGGGYLIYLGIKTLMQRKSLGQALSPRSQPYSDIASFAHGFTVGITNPKTVVFLAAILPQFVSRAAGNVAGQVLLLGLLFALIAVASDALWALTAGTLRSWFARSPQRLELIGGAGGLSIAAVGLAFLITGRKD